MKRVLIITVNKKGLIYLSLCLLVFFTTIVTVTVVHFNRNSQVFNNREVDGILEMEKENSTLKNLLSSFLPEEQKTIFEDERRNIFLNTGITPPTPLPTSPLSKVIAQGVETKFRILSDDPQYLRPIYSPHWKGAYYRGWLYLPYKNIEARHRIFAFSLGASMNYDISGSLGYSPKSSPNAPVDNHRNINFLIYGFDIKDVKVFQNQVALLGEPKQTGAQIVSIVQNDLLPEGVDTKEFLFQLSTPKGYEVDFLNHNIIRYEYLMKQIEEHTVPSFADETENKSLEKLLKENAALKRELTFFIPQQDELIHHQVSEGFSNDTGDPSNTSAAIQQGKKIPFVFNYNHPQYKRPLYSPLWKTNYKRKWAYIPKQVESNMHRLHIIPQGQDLRYDFFGILGFHGNYQPVKSDQYGFLIYNFDVSKAIVYKNQLIFIGVPSRTGAEILSIEHDNLKDYKNYLVRLVTPDNSEFDCTVLTQN